MSDKLTKIPIIKKILTKFPETKPLEFRGDLMAIVSKEVIPELLPFLKNDPDLKFDYLVDITAVDRLNLDEEVRFAVVYHLYSFKYNHRIRINALVPEDDGHIASVCSFWEAANWLEREVYDMFGIVFDDHPNLVRILMPDYFEGYPLRKDYPLRGRGERENFDFS